MAISYNWKIESLETYPTLDSNSDVIYKVHWRLTGTDDANDDSYGNALTADTYGTQSLDTSDISSFKAFASVNATTVQGWVETAMGADDVQAKKDSIDAQIALLVTPTSVTKTLAS
tara:strand:+ start:1578 stop:1925 length:348 start_codon:yes stop_codon:yes gene_type:complete